MFVAMSSVPTFWGLPLSLQSSLVPKVWYFVINAGSVFLLPCVNLFYRQLGFSPEQIGILAALKPWLSAASGSALMGLADTHKLHYFLLLVTYLVQFLGRSTIALAGASFGLQLVIALVTEAAASPLGTVVDAAVTAAATDEGGYGRARLWASVGWGVTAPIAGAVAAHAGLKTSFLFFSLLMLLGVLPTLALPVRVLSQQQDKDKESAHRIDGAHSLPDRRSRRMDSDIVIKEDQAESCLKDLPDLPPLLPGGVKSAPHVPVAGPLWSIPSQGRQPDPASPAVIMLAPDARLAAGAAAASSAVSPVALTVALPRRSTTNGGMEALSLECSRASLASGGKEAADTSAVGKHVGAWEGIKSLLSDVNVCVFFFLSFLAGVGNGCIGYIFLYLSELGADSTLMGLCLSFNCAAEVPVFYFSGQIIRRLGVQTSFNVAMACYALRLLCYVLLPLAPTPYFVLAAELLQGCTFALAFSAGCCNVKRIAPEHLRSTTQALFAGLYGGWGAGLGGLLGGLLYGRLGGRAMFGCAAAAIVLGWLAANAVLWLGDPKKHEGYEAVGVSPAHEDEEAQQAP